MATPLTGTSASDAQGAHSKDRRGQVCMSHNERVWEALPISMRRRQSSGRLHHGLDPSPAPLLTLRTGAVHHPPRQPQPLQDQPEGRSPWEWAFIFKSPLPSSLSLFLKNIYLFI